MNLTIGLLRQDAGWERLLTQIGTAWRVFDASQTMTTDAFSVMIVNAEPTSMQRKHLNDYVNAGGSVLADGGTVRHFLDCTCAKKRFTSVDPRECAPFSPSSILDVHATGLVVVKCRDRRIEGGTAVQVLTDELSTVVSLPFSVSVCVLGTGSVRKNFYAPPERLPSEHVSTVSKGAMRQFVTNILEFLHHRRSLPFVHTWYYPGGAPTIFTFRIDTDKGSEAEMKELYDVCAKHGVPGTWFVDVEGREDSLGFFSSFSGQEIGLHCYRHETAAVRDEVYANFHKGLRLLLNAGHDIRGASAPCGTWNAAVDSVYRELRMAYSSEFSLDYDDMPFFPIMPVVPDAPSAASTPVTTGATPAVGRESTVMQLPIHPICVGSMKRSRYTSLQMREYFRTWVWNRIASREPVCLYHHPTHHHWEVFDDIFSFVKEMKLPMLSYSAYAEWWRKRTAAVPQFTLENGVLSVTHGSTSPGSTLSPIGAASADAAGSGGGMWYRIAYPGREETITEITGGIALADAPRRPVGEPAAIPGDILRARKFDPRHPLINFLDYWYKTTQ